MERVIRKIEGFQSDCFFFVFLVVVVVVVGEREK
jgi:hypothetical protein